MKISLCGKRLWNWAQIVTAGCCDIGYSGLAETVEAGIATQLTISRPRLHQVVRHGQCEVEYHQVHGHWQFADPYSHSTSPSRLLGMHTITHNAVQGNDFGARSLLEDS